LLVTIAVVLQVYFIASWNGGGAILVFALAAWIAYRDFKALRASGVVEPA
jgi:hypothetical protein